MSSLADLGEKVEAVRLLARDGRGTDGTPVERDGALRHGRIVLDRFALRSGRPPLLVLPRGGPPRSPRSFTLARAADVTILVVRRGHTKRDIVTSTLESLELARAKLVRTVLQTSRRPI